jgi:hypothetical protein
MESMPTNKSPTHSGSFSPLRQKPTEHGFNSGDILVLFGELFNRGYANGLVDEAQKKGMKIIRATVGRRDENLNLRPLTEDELQTQLSLPQFKNSPLINIPLEAGFDLEQDNSGQRTIDYLKGFKLSEWAKAAVPEKSIYEARDSARKRFQKNVNSFLIELEKYITPGTHIHFAHLMAGGVPRTKIVMPLLNRVFKGTGDRYLSSQEFWQSSIGKFMEINFHEVTAHTYHELIQLSTPLRERQIKSGGTVSYVAYGYHGTEVVVNNEYSWQSYTPYIQGWAKIDLENISRAWFAKDVQTCVYNCPEILTNSSSIFQGVEIALYNLIRALRKENSDHPVTQKIVNDCTELLTDPKDLETIFSLVDEYISFADKTKASEYTTWPQHSTKLQLEKLLSTSDQIFALHKNENAFMTATLSEIIFKSCGYVMLHDAYKPKHPVAWIGHDIVSQCV